MLLHDINHKMPIYRDATLAEVLCIGSFVFMTEALLFSAITKVVFGYAVIGVALTMISFFHVTLWCLKKLQRIKYGKPFAFYKHLLMRQLCKLGFYKNTYITRESKWSVWRAK